MLPGKHHPGGYLSVAAVVVAVAAAFIPCLMERAWHDRQLAKFFALLIVLIPCAAMVLLTALERNHAGRAGGEAERASYRQTVERAKADLADAKADAKAATAAADKVRGLDTKACKKACVAAKANEAPARDRVAAAEKALAAAEAKAVTESATKAPLWLLPAALDGLGLCVLSVAFGLGRMPEKASPPAPAPVEAPAEPVLTKRQIAARKGAETRKRNATQKQRMLAKARKTGPRLAVTA